MLLGLLERLLHQRVTQPLAACLRGDDYAPDHHVAVLRVRVEQAQVGHQVVALPGHQMASVAFKVQAVDILVGAVLLDNEYFGTQFEDGIQLFLAQVIVMFADPLDIHF